MSQIAWRRWLPRFSLKTFLLLWLFGGGGVAWLSLSYSEYLSEQRLLADLTARNPGGTFMTVVVNGETEYFSGNIFM